MDQVKCRFEILPVNGLNSNELTVGRHAILTCEGDFSKSFDFSKAQIKLEEQNKLIAKIIKAEVRSAQSFDIDITFYVAGSLQFPDLVITDGVNEISLGAQKFEIKSVIEKTETSQPPKPFGYLIPLRIEWPVFYFIFFISLIVLVILALIFKIRQAARFAKMMSDLRQYESPQAADLQFYKSIRLAEKNDFPLADLEKAFRLYVLRTFQVPLFVLSQKQIVRFLKKHKSHLKKERQQIDKFLSEFDEMQKNKKILTANEKSDFIKKLYRFIDLTQNQGRSS